MHETAEISYDLVMDEDMHFVEGTYRLSGCEWRVMIFSRSDEVDEPVVVADARWAGVRGVHVTWPDWRAVNKEVVEQLMSSVCGVRRRVEVRGPDSMVLR